MSPEPPPEPVPQRKPLDDQFAADVVALLQTTLTLTAHALRARHPGLDLPGRAEALFSGDPGFEAARRVLAKVRDAEAALLPYRATLQGVAKPPAPAPQGPIEPRASDAENGS